MSPVDSFKFIDPITTRIIKSWIGREHEREIPWTPLSRPLSEAAVSLISTAGIAPRSGPPFDQQTERDDPWWGDPSYRAIPAQATSGDVGLHHLHINTRYGEEDLDCVLPLRRLAELQNDGVVGRVAPTHYSFMGYLPNPDTFLSESVPSMIENMRSEEVDVALLAPV